jgi:hypothetical protein
MASYDGLVARMRALDRERALLGLEHNRLQAQRAQLDEGFYRHWSGKSQAWKSTPAGTRLSEEYAHQSRVLQARMEEKRRRREEADREAREVHEQVRALS